MATTVIGAILPTLAKHPNLGYNSQDGSSPFYCQAGDSALPRRRGMQLHLFEDSLALGRSVVPFKVQLLKWIGNKQRFAHEIVRYFPGRIGTYIEPFLGSGAVLATLAPERAIASDLLKPLIEIWQMLAADPDQLIAWYAERWQAFHTGDRVTHYEHIKAAYNIRPNGADLLFLSRSCYGGVVRFRQEDGVMSTPVVFMIQSPPVPSPDAPKSGTPEHEARRFSTLTSRR
jgi:hypothetical protein